MSAQDHWACAAVQHPGGRVGQHGFRTGCAVSTGHDPSSAPRDCYTCKQAATKRYRGETRQRADQEHFACTLAAWEHDGKLMGSLGGHRDGCATLPGHERTPGKKCPGCRRRYSGAGEVTKMEEALAIHPHYDCSLPLLAHRVRPRIGRGHRLGCQIAEGHREGKVSACPVCVLIRGGDDYHRRTMLRAKYGLSMEEYAALLERQHGVCAICGQPPNEGGVLHVDHDHTTGVVRGLLCPPCNTGLGNFRDDQRLLRRAIRYLG